MYVWCMHAYDCGYVHAIVQVWKSEDHLVFHLIWHRVSAVHCCLFPLHTPGSLAVSFQDSPVPTFHLSLGSLGLQMHAPTWLYMHPTLQRLHGVWRLVIQMLDFVRSFAQQALRPETSSGLCPCPFRRARLSKQRLENKDADVNNFSPTFCAKY